MSCQKLQVHSNLDHQTSISTELFEYSAVSKRRFYNYVHHMLFVNFSQPVTKFKFWNPTGSLKSQAIQNFLKYQDNAWNDWASLHFQSDTKNVQLDSLARIICSISFRFKEKGFWVKPGTQSYLANFLPSKLSSGTAKIICTYNLALITLQDQ